MPTIHISTFLHDKDRYALDVDNVPEQLEDCAKKLEELAKQYKKMAKTLRAKEIKIAGTEGDATCGFINLDEIDTGRLRKLGLVTEVEEGGCPETPFYLDKKLDQLLQDAMAEDLNGSLDVDDKEINSTIFFDKETNTFTFKCNGCDEIHSQDLDTVYESIDLAKYLIEPLLEPLPGSDEDPETTDILAENASHAINQLGFLQLLLEQEYGISPQCDHDHDEEHDNVEDEDHDED